MSDALIKSLYHIHAVQFGEFTLKNGTSSNVYIDLRPIISYPTLLQQVAHVLWGIMKSCRFDVICGVPYTALPIATTLSIQHSLPMVMRRKEAKSYGTKKKIEGQFKQGHRCLIIEDIITTGSSILETAHDLREAGLVVNDAIVLINREQGGETALLEQGIHLHAALSLETLLKISSENIS